MTTAGIPTTPPLFVNTQATRTADARFPWLGLSMLSFAVFLSVSSEMLPTGLLPEMSAGLGVSQSQVGLLVSIFAFTVVLTSAPLTILTKRLPRRALVIAVLLIFAASNAWTALAPSYEMVVASRVLGGLAHGVFWAVVGAYASYLVPRRLIGRAVSLVISGGTLAFILGVPLGTWLGHMLGWRLAFGVLAGVTLLITIMVARFLPAVVRDQPAPARTTAARATSTLTTNTDPVSARAARRARRDPTILAVALVCTITSIVMIGHYSFYTYIAPYLIDAMGMSTDAVGPLLFVFGIAGAGGLIVAGSLGSQKPRMWLLIALVASAVTATVLGLFADQTAIAMIAYVLWGLAFGALPPLLQTRLLHVASVGIRDTASSFYTTGFNIGIGGGALLGAIVFDQIGLVALPFVYVGILLVALTLVLVGDRFVPMPVTAQLSTIRSR
ncbi:MFS transporter [Homoserinimonas sp. OAct 916]|uniref:MFS transporter n=1 Tax=Homoserinimonas sp. OAct 916 TaxID=2211450 RepID=UPI001E381EB2|nr:MFS transporter [Homoserinimonas sp. OAct 916]